MSSPREYGKIAMLTTAIVSDGRINESGTLLNDNIRSFLARHTDSMPQKILRTRYTIFFFSDIPVSEIGY